VGGTVFPPLKRFFYVFGVFVPFFGKKPPGTAVCWGGSNKNPKSFFPPPFSPPEPPTSSPPPPLLVPIFQNVWLFSLFSQSPQGALNRNGGKKRFFQRPWFFFFSPLRGLFFPPLNFTPCVGGGAFFEKIWPPRSKISFCRQQNFFRQRGPSEKFPPFAPPPSLFC